MTATLMGVRPAVFAFFINDFERTTQPALGAADQQERADGIDRRALATDDLPHIRGMHPQFINGHPVAFGGSDRDRIGPINQPLHHVIEKSFHNRQLPSWPAKLKQQRLSRERFCALS